MPNSLGRENLGRPPGNRTLPFPLIWSPQQESNLCHALIWRLRGIRPPFCH